MIINKVDINKLNSAKYNPRKDLKPGDIEYEQLKKSIKHFGYVDPIIVNKNNMVVVGGHQRLKVLKELGYSDIDVVFVELNDNEEKALNVALNKISGDWDAEKLEDILRDLKLDTDFDETLTGFTDEEIETLFGNTDELNDEINNDSIDDNIDNNESLDKDKIKDASSISICAVTLLGQTYDTISIIKLSEEQVETLIKYIEKNSEEEFIKKVVECLE